MQTIPASLKRAIIPASGPRPKLTAPTRSLLARITSTISRAPGWKLWKLTPNRCGVSLPVSAIASASSAGFITAPARNPNAPALLLAATRRGVAIQPIAVCTTGRRHPSSAVSGVASGSAKRQSSPVCRLFFSAIFLPSNPAM